MNARNFQRELDRLLERLAAEGRVPRLFLHSCCAPCSSYVLEYLSKYFEITVFYYNPNIYPPKEYDERLAEVRRLVSEMEFAHPVTVVAGAYDPALFFDAVKGLEAEKEGGARCERCFRLRLMEAARLAKDGGYDYFTTTLTVGPKKDARLLNQLGEEIGSMYGVAYLNSDFKKKNGHVRSLELSEQYGLYRQDYCGCVFSRRRGDAGAAASGRDAGDLSF